MFDPSFLGKSPLTWFIGQVPLNQTKNRISPDGWGDRVQVRIVGHNPAEGNQIPDDKLDWAVILRSTSHGSLNRMSTGITGGEWVIGVFANTGVTKKLPIIIGVLGRSDPTYQITSSEAEKKKSAEFKKTLNWYADIQPELYHTLNAKEPGKPASQTRPSLSSKMFKKK